MRDIKQMYNLSIKENELTLYNYTPIFESFGYTIILMIPRTNDKIPTDLGATRVLFKDTSRFGYLYLRGSTNLAQDPLFACKTWDDVQTLQQTLYSKILWAKNEVDLFLTLMNRNWEEVEGVRPKVFIIEATKVLLEENWLAATQNERSIQQKGED